MYSRVHGAQHEEAPEAEDHARHGGPHLDGRREWGRNPSGRPVREREGASDADRNGKEHGNERRLECAHDEDQSAVVGVDRIPRCPS